MSLLDTIKNEEFCIETVFEYFQGKYSKEEVKTLLFEFHKWGNLNVRRGVSKLCEEWNALKAKDLKTVENWYSSTEFYIFDLLPWNGCDMFKQKMDPLIELIKSTQLKNIVDYGAGLGITTLLLKEAIPDATLTYVDFLDSHQYRFLVFLTKKLGLEMPKVIDVADFMKSKEWCDLIFSMDCFEHVVNLDDTINVLCSKTNTLIHDSCFDKNDAQPQHVNHKGNHWFVNYMLKQNFFMPGNDFRIFKKFRMQLLQTGELAMAFYDAHDTSYGI